jgi:hypothetical protein
MPLPKPNIEVISRYVWGMYEVCTGSLARHCEVSTKDKGKVWLKRAGKQGTFWDLGILRLWDGRERAWDFMAYCHGQQSLDFAFGL